MAGATTMASSCQPALPPERLTRWPRAGAFGVNRRADRHLGARHPLLCEIASGVKPFGGQTVPELFSSILRDSPAALPEAVPIGLRVDRVDAWKNRRNDDGRMPAQSAQRSRRSGRGQIRSQPSVITSPGGAGSRRSERGRGGRDSGRTQRRRHAVTLLRQPA